MVDFAVVGGGPGGMMLAYLLARGGASVAVLESHGGFDRRFRGDSIAPAVLDYLNTLGLADYRRASCRYPYYALIPKLPSCPTSRARPPLTPASSCAYAAWSTRCCAMGMGASSASPTAKAMSAGC